MIQFLKNRVAVSALVIVLIFALLVVSLFDMTVLQADAYDDLSVASKTRTITLTGNRGKILDTNLVPLAYDQDTYDVQFYREAGKNTSADRASYTKSLIETIEIIERGGGEVIDGFYIKRNENGEFVFDFGTTDADVAKKRETLWRSNMYLQNEELTPYDCYVRLRDTYQIPQTADFELACKLLSIWQQVQYTQYLAYSPVTIASDVNLNVVAEVESRSDTLLGVSVAMSTQRVYPKGEQAAHVVGYTGRIYDTDQLEEMQEKGYASDDAVGISGIEATMEAILTPNILSRKGMQKVEVDNRGRILQVLDSQEPLPGNDVVLSLDFELQQKVEQALEDNIATIRAQQEAVLAADYANIQKELQASGRDVEDLNLAETGAAIVMDPNTGKVLALASSPSFDPNKFVGGISEEDYRGYADDERSPLFNKAISSKGTPGSIFKMVTGLGGLMEGVVGVQEQIDDQGPWAVPGTQPAENAPRCWIRPNYSRHSGQTIVEAVKNSCNYYFMTVAYRLGIDQLAKWGENLGLTTKTNIELTNEAVGQIGGQQYLYDNTKSIDDQASYTPYLVHRKLATVELVQICEQEGIEYTAEQLESIADKLIKVVGADSDWGPEFRRILREDLGIFETVSNAKGYDRLISQRLYELLWTPLLTATSGIGQARVQITPIAAARYISALINGGHVYEAQLVDRVVDAQGNTIEQKQPVVANELDASQAYLDKIKIGLQEVVSEEVGGTASSVFKDFKYKDNLGGKTGTAQVSDIELENDAWFVSFAPYEQPEIVVVLYIPHGYKGSNAAQAAKEIIQFYLDRQSGETAQATATPAA